MRTKKTKAYPLSMKKKVVKAYEKLGLTLDQVARKFNIGAATVSRYWHEYCENGDVSEPKSKYKVNVMNEENTARVKKLIMQNRHSSDAQICRYFNKNRKNKVSIYTISRIRQHLGFAKAWMLVHEEIVSHVKR